MKPRPFLERAQRIIDALSERIDAQAMRPGADAPHCVSVVGVFHTYAGNLERAIERMRVVNLPSHVRTLRRIVETHRIMVALRAIRSRKG